MPRGKFGLTQFVCQARQRESVFAGTGRVFERDTQFSECFGFAAGGRENPGEQGAPFGIGWHLAKLSAQSRFGLGGAAGLHQSPNVIRRRAHAGRLIETTWSPFAVLRLWVTSPRRFARTTKRPARAQKTQDPAVRRKILSTRRITPSRPGGWHETCRKCPRGSLRTGTSWLDCNSS